MSATLVFDTLAYTKKLREAGVPERQAEVQAEALAEVIDSSLATKQDIKDIRNDISNLEKKVDNLEERLTNKLTIRLGGIVVAGIGVLSVLMHLHT